MMIEIVAIYYDRDVDSKIDYRSTKSGLYIKVHSSLTTKSIVTNF